MMQDTHKFTSNVNTFGTHHSIVLCINIRSKAIKIVSRYLGSKECYVLSFKDLFCTAGITKPHEIKTYFFLFLCLFFSVCFHAVKGISLEPT